MTAKQIDRLISVLERFADVATRWADAEYPIENEVEGTISRVGDRQRPQSVEEYKYFEAEEPSTLEKRLRSNIAT